MRANAMKSEWNENESHEETCAARLPHFFPHFHSKLTQHSTDIKL